MRRTGRWCLVQGYPTLYLTSLLVSGHYHLPPTSEPEKREQVAYLCGGRVLSGLSRQGASIVGIALANVIPTRWGLGFAGILALLGVGCSLASTQLRRVSAGVAGMAAVVAYALPLKLNIVVAIASAVALCLIIEETWPTAPGVRA